MMRISLIGMSGSGKSYWAARLTERGFKRFCCDELIESKLAPQLVTPDGSVISLGEWMGFPYEFRYQEREAKYLACEIECLREVLNYFEGTENSWDEDIVIDTTGSVIYTGEDMLGRLRRNTTVVHMATPPEVQDRMLAVYVANQRPVLWRDFFINDPQETSEEALARCYPKLLASRELLYKRYSHVTIDYYQASEPGFGVSGLLRLADIRGA